MAKEEITTVVDEEVTTSEFTQEEVASEPETDSTLDTSEVEENFEVVDEVVETIEETDFEKKDEEEEEETSDSESEESSDTEDEDDKDKKYSLLEQQYEDLSAQYSQLKADYDALVEFKEQVEDKEKDALIAEFYMLSDEDKAEIIENKKNYSLDEIKAKLAVICYEKKVNFNSDDSSENDKEVVITYNFNDNSANLPDWIKAVKAAE